MVTKTEHDPWCARPGWTVEPFDEVVELATCAGCGARRVVFPPDRATPQARYQAGLARDAGEAS